jgi:hypothetical protein
MTKSCHGFKAASQQNRFCGRFFLCRRCGVAESAAIGGNSGGRPACILSSIPRMSPCISLAGDVIDRLSLETATPQLFCFREAPQARGHA